MPANALHGQIEPVLDLRVKAACTVDCHLAVYTIAGKDHHPADRVADAMERFAFDFRDLLDNLPESHLLANVGITASLDNQYSPRSERWCRYGGVLMSSSNGAPFGKEACSRGAGDTSERRTESVGISSWRRSDLRVEGNVDHRDERQWAPAASSPPRRVYARGSCLSTIDDLGSAAAGPARAAGGDRSLPCDRWPASSCATDDR